MLLDRQFNLNSTGNVYFFSKLLAYALTIVQNGSEKVTSNKRLFHKNAW